MPIIFAYATLRDAALRKRLLHRDVPTSRAEITGYERVEVDIPKHAYNAVRAPGKVLDGELFAVSQSEIKTLDAWEADYKRDREETTRGIVCWMFRDKDA